MGSCGSFASFHPSSAKAQPRVTLRIAADGCPTAQEVRELLEPLLGHELALRALAPHESAAAQADVWVRDLGASYAIEVAGAERTQSNPARECTERARVAAVFIALNLQTPSAAEREQPAVAIVAEPREPANVASASPEPVREDSVERVALELGAFATLGSKLPDAQLVPGVGLELVVRRLFARAPEGTLRRGLVLGLRAAVEGEHTLDVTPSASGGSAPLGARAKSGEARLLRLPSALFAGLLWRVAPLSLGPSAGVAVDLLRARGHELSQSARAVRANVGGYLALQARLSLSSRVSLTSLLSASLFPRSYELRVEPEGRQAHTPRVWLALGLGILCRLR